MAVKIRLMRVGKKKQPSYRVVVADSRSPRDGRIIERIGTYAPRQEPSGIEIDGPRALDWLHKGAQPTDQVQKLLEATGVWAEFKEARPGAGSDAERRLAAKRRALAKRAAEQAAQPQPEPEPEAPAAPAEEPAAEGEAAGAVEQAAEAVEEAAEAAEEVADAAEDVAEAAAATAEEPAGEEPAAEEPAAESEEQTEA